MPWKCYAIKSLRQGEWEPSKAGGKIRQVYYTLENGQEVTLGDMPPGAMWHSSQQPPDSHLAGRNSIIVLLPRKLLWAMNCPGTNGHMWDVRGEIPNVTANPSINFVGLYHGWVQNGIVSDDCEGRIFDAMGKLVEHGS